MRRWPRPVGAAMLSARGPAQILRTGRMGCTEREIPCVERDVPCGEREIPCVQREVRCVEREVPCVQGDVGSIHSQLRSMRRRVPRVRRDVRPSRCGRLCAVGRAPGGCAEMHFTTEDTEGHRGGKEIDGKGDRRVKRGALLLVTARGSLSFVGSRAARQCVPVLTGPTTTISRLSRPHDSRPHDLPTSRPPDLPPGSLNSNANAATGARVERRWPRVRCVAISAVGGGCRWCRPDRARPMPTGSARL